MKFKIVDCSCKHAHQDKIHGEGKRVANQMARSSIKDPHRYRCTVCGRVGWEGA